jgi:hypothetical protein
VPYLGKERTMLTNSEVLAKFMRGEEGKGRVLVSDGKLLVSGGHVIAARAKNAKLGTVEFQVRRLTASPMQARHVDALVAMINGVLTPEVTVARVDTVR